MSGQQNSILSVVPGITFQTSEQKGIYQLQTINFQVNKNARKELQQSSLIKSNQSDLLVSAFLKKNTVLCARSFGINPN